MLIINSQHIINIQFSKLTIPFFPMKSQFLPYKIMCDMRKDRLNAFQSPAYGVRSFVIMH